MPILDFQLKSLALSKFCDPKFTPLRLTTFEKYPEISPCFPFANFMLSDKMCALLGGFKFKICS